jgi:tRNA 2-selenouridine synthase SelU
MPQIFIFIIALILCLFFNSSTFAQNTEQKTQDLIAALGKTKYKKKEKKNFSSESFIDVKSEAVIKNNVQDYAGVYHSQKRIAGLNSEFRVTAKWKEAVMIMILHNSRKLSFTLKDALIEGALLTATKIYATGETKKLEAVFNNRTITQEKIRMKSTATKQNMD